MLRESLFPALIVTILLTMTSPVLSVLILPNCGPDMKYFLAFTRTQLSTSITMILVFGPKVRLKTEPA